MSENQKNVIIYIVIAIVVGLLFLLFVWFFWKRRSCKRLVKNLNNENKKYDETLKNAIKYGHSTTEKVAFLKKTRYDGDEKELEDNNCKNFKKMLIRY